MAAFKPWTYNADGTTIRCADGATKNPKKMTGSRLGAIVGLNKWKSPFEAWCEIMRVGEQPFEDNKYTVAGRSIEPKLVEWCKTEISPNIVTPEEFYDTGDAARFMGYDFFKEDPVFGGMWDALVKDAQGHVVGLVECKTSSRPQDWANGVPDSYAIQSLMYADRLGVESVFVPVALMNDTDYDDPESFVCTDDNTFLYELSVSETDIDAVLTKAARWWTKHVEGNESPTFDEKADKTILKVIRSNEVKCDDIAALASEADELTDRIAAIKAESDMDALEKRLDLLKKQMKSAIIEKFTETDSDVSSHGWVVKKATRSSIDKEALTADGLIEKYTTQTVSYTLNKEKS